MGSPRSAESVRVSARARLRAQRLTVSNTTGSVTANSGCRQHPGSRGDSDSRVIRGGPDCVVTGRIEVATQRAARFHEDNAWQSSQSALEKLQNCRLWFSPLQPRLTP